MPAHLDLKQFRNFVNPDMWFDERSIAAPKAVLPETLVVESRTIADIPTESLRARRRAGVSVAFGGGLVL